MGQFISFGNILYLPKRSGAQRRSELLKKIITSLTD